MKGENMYFRDYKHKYSWNIAGRIITCTAISHVNVAGRVVTVKGTGVARCRDDDIFDEQFGKELSKIRAKAELCRKIENVFIDETKKSSWKKPVGISQEIFKQVSIYLDDHTLKNIEEFVICTMGGQVLGTIKI